MYGWSFHDCICKYISSHGLCLCLSHSSWVVGLPKTNLCFATYSRDPPHYCAIKWKRRKPPSKHQIQDKAQTWHISLNSFIFIISLQTIINESFIKLRSFENFEDSPQKLVWSSEPVLESMSSKKAEIKSAENNKNIRTTTRNNWSYFFFQKLAIECGLEKLRA